MLISQSALICLEATWQRLTGRAAEIVLDPPPVQLVPTEPISAPVPTAQAQQRRDLVATASVGTSETRASMAVSAPALDAPLSAAELRARAAGLRALTLSRSRKFAAARSAFAEAARLDPGLDLTRIPGFWRLERSAHEAAIAAYLETGREGDAAVLRARVQSTYRPKPLRNRAAAAAAP